MLDYKQCIEKLNIRHTFLKFSFYLFDVSNLIFQTLFTTLSIFPRSKPLEICFFIYFYLFENRLKFFASSIWRKKIVFVFTLLFSLAFPSSAVFSQCLENKKQKQMQLVNCNKNTHNKTINLNYICNMAKIWKIVISVLRLY